MMSIPYLVWRPRAKMVAVIDLVLSVLAFVFTLVSAVLRCIVLAVVQVVAHGIEYKNGNNGEAQNSAARPSTTTTTHLSTISIWILWVGVAVSAAHTALQMWTDWRLLKSTDLRRTREEAVKHVRFWLIISLVLLVIWVPLEMVVLGAYVIGGIGLVIRFIFIIVVYQFMEELKQAINSAHAPISKVAPI